MELAGLARQVQLVQGEAGADTQYIFMRRFRQTRGQTPRKHAYTQIHNSQTIKSTRQNNRQDSNTTIIPGRV